MSSEEGSTVTFRRAPADLRRSDMKRSVERFARMLQAKVAKGRSFDCLIAGDAELRRLNREYRGQDYATDVLSFPAVPSYPAAPSYRAATVRERSLGDIAISLARARSQARQYGHTPEREIQILMLHGVLHLLGMDHETDRGRMARAEKRWRARLGLPNGLIERVRS
jgi:probable rRNA maturation factor